MNHMYFCNRYLMGCEASNPYDKGVNSQLKKIHIYIIETENRIKLFKTGYH